MRTVPGTLLKWRNVWNAQKLVLKRPTHGCPRFPICWTMELSNLPDTPVSFNGPFLAIDAFSGLGNGSSSPMPETVAGQRLAGQGFGQISDRRSCADAELARSRIAPEQGLHCQ